MSGEPKVTGLSPMTGPPGTKITVRGDNLGQSSEDIIGLTINHADCLPYLEWSTSKKISTRCSEVLGSGDVIITTRSGGVGTCDVQFNCYEEKIGPTDESAVWVEESDFKISNEEKLNIPGFNEEYSVDISSPKFNPQLYLKRFHSNATLDELEQILKTFRDDLANKSDPDIVSKNSNRAALLKSNLPVVMECLQIIEHLSKVIKTSRDTSIDNIIKGVQQSLGKTHELFDPLLAQKDLVQSIESAMQVFRQNETLFNLPSAIESSIKTKNYDSVVKEISDVLMRLKTININQSLFEKIRQDVTTKVDQLKKTIEAQLYESCKITGDSRNLEEVKKLITHLNRLGEGKNDFDVWIALTEMSRSLVSTLSSEHDRFLSLQLKESKQDNVQSNRTSRDSSPSRRSEPPYVVQFVQIALKIFHDTYYDILALGQSYFDPKDEFACKESDELRHARQMEFDEVMISQPISHLVSLLRSALVPESPKLDKDSGWPSNEIEAYVEWLRHVLKSVISCHIHLGKVSLPAISRTALDDMREFVFELRESSMKVLFSVATRVNKELHLKEDWVITVDDVNGGITKMPSIFEQNVIQTLCFAKDTIFKPSSPDEKSILEKITVQASMKGLAQGLINSFIDSLENALIHREERSAESTRFLLASRNSEREPSEYSQHILITICNCQYTKDKIFMRLQDEFEKLHGLKMDAVFKGCSKKYCDYIAKISEKFCLIMTNKLGLEQTKSNGDLEELQVGLMVVNSQIFLIAPQLVNSLMTRIVNSVQDVSHTRRIK